MSRASRQGCLALVALGLLAAAARADLIFMQDGHVMQGTVKREVSAELDSYTKEMIIIPKGFFMLDDGPRRVYFSPKQVRIVEKLPAPADERVVSRKMSLILSPRQLPPLLQVVEAGAWDFPAWKREYHFRTDYGHVGLFQGVATISPYYARVDALNKFRWSAAYLTREWEPEVVHKLLLANPELQDPVAAKPAPAPRPRRGRPAAKEPPAEKVSPEEQARRDEKLRTGMLAARRMRLCDFFAQAGWFDIAEKELDRLVADLPAEKERAARARLTIDKLRARDLWEQTKNWYQAGRYQAVARRLAAFPGRNVPDRIQTDMREMKARLAGAQSLLAEADEALQACSKEAVESKRGRELASAVRVIREELHPDTVGRLDAFLGQVREAARQKARAQKRTQTPETLLALAVSGWLLGSPSAEADTQAAVNLWKTRQLVLAYLQEPLASERQKRLEKYTAEITPRVDFDEIAQVIDHLPPADPVKLLPGTVVKRQVGRGRGTSHYYLRLPPEYTPNRQYPVLLLLHQSGEGAKEAMDRWAKGADDHGYILAAPDWDNGLGNAEYGYSPAEHDTVLDALRDLRRSFGVDSDRVFLHGLGEGGKMAFDVGLAHPDLFAGVLPMGAGPDKYCRRYWRNAQYLPFYVVNGSKGGDSNNLLRDQFKHWVQRGFPTLWVEYKGRGLEWFGGEVPNMFDWMRNQKRDFPLRQLGVDGGGSEFGTEFCTMRPDDNRFYWLSTSAISPRNILDPGRPFSNLTSPAAMTGRIDKQTNDIHLRTQGLNQVSVWIGRNPRGQFMIDFAKPVTVRVGFKNFLNRRFVQPSLSVLLEDLYARGDRKHLFVARIDLDLRRGLAAVAGLAGRGRD